MQNWMKAILAFSTLLGPPAAPARLVNTSPLISSVSSTVPLWTGKTTMQVSGWSCILTVLFPGKCINTASFPILFCHVMCGIMQSAYLYLCYQPYYILNYYSNCKFHIMYISLEKYGNRISETSLSQEFLPAPPNVSRFTSIRI